MTYTVFLSYRMRDEDVAAETFTIDGALHAAREVQRKTGGYIYIAAPNPLYGRRGRDDSKWVRIGFAGPLATSLATECACNGPYGDYCSKCYNSGMIPRT